MNRRLFLRSVCAAAAVGLSPRRGASELRRRTRASTEAAHVAVVRREGLAALRGRARAEAYEKALDSAFSTLGEEFLPRVLDNRRSVSLKLNCLAGIPLSPCPELVEALASALRDSGAREVVAWERSTRELGRAGFASRGTSYSLDATDAVGYSRTLFEARNVGSLLSNVLLRCDALVSVGVLKDHDLAGISCAMKNLYGAIHNPNKYHAHRCDPYVAEVVSLAPIRQRLCLAVLDGATAQCHGGPSYKAAWAWAFDGIVVSDDAVAADVVAAGIIEAQRARRGLPSLEEAKRAPTWIQTAGQLGLGEHRIGAIRVQEVAL